MGTPFTALIIPARTGDPVRVEPIGTALEDLRELVDGDVPEHLVRRAEELFVVPLAAPRVPLAA